MKPLLPALILAAAPLAAGAVTVTSCDVNVANARNLTRPYEDATRTFGEGAIGFLSLTVEEPACCGAALMVVYPDPETGFSLCAIVTTDDGMGWSTTDLPAATARYDATRGLTVAVPTRRFDGVDFADWTVTVTVNRQTGEVTATDRAS